MSPPPPTSPSATPSGEPTSGAAADPVRARRQQIAKWTLLANRVGYLCFAAAIVAFVLAFALGFTGTMSAIIITSLVLGSMLLAPAIVLGYAVKAAEREDRERGL